MLSAPHNRSVRISLITGVAAVLAVVGALLVATTAQADTVALSGVVRGPTGLPLAGVTVSGVDFDSDIPTIEGTATTSSTGAFTFAALPLGINTLSFSATSTTFFQYLGGTSNINAYQILGLDADTAHDKSYISVTLSASGTISGKVSKVPSGVVAGYTVRAYAQAADGSWSIAGSAKTSSSGAYAVTGLEPGSYRLEAIDTTSAHPVYSPEYSGGGTDFSNATSIGVVASKTTSYTFAVGKAGSVSGTVTGVHGVPSAVEKLGSVHVTVYRLTGTPGSFTAADALDSPSTVTSSTGAYSVSGLAPGYYTLEFNPPGSAPYSPSGTQYGRTFLGGFDDPTQATSFQIGNGTVVVGKNIQLAGTATISGTVYDAANPTTPISNVRVMVDYAGRDADLPSEHAQTAHTDDNGNFTFTDLGPGTYELYVGSNATTDSNYENENWEWIRQIVNVPGPLAVGGSASVNVYMTHMDPSFLYSTTQPVLNTSSGVVGDTISVTTGVWDASDATNFQYQWFNDGTPISGATQSSYTLRPSDDHDYVVCEVTANSFGYGRAIADSSNNILVQDGSLVAPSPSPSVSGTNAVGDTLTVDPGGWSVSGTQFVFDWQVSPDGSTWHDVQDNASPNLYLTGSDYATGDQVRVQVSANKQGYNGLEVTAYDSGDVVQSPIQLLTPPTVKKTSAGFSLVGGVWSPTAFDSEAINWLVTAPNGTQTAYNDQPVLTLANAGSNYVTVTEGRTYTGYTNLTSNPIVAQLGAAPVPTGTNVLIGTPQVDAPVTAPNPSWVPTGGTSTWQWEYESGTTWKAIAAATGATYDPTAGYVGRLLRVITTRKNIGYNAATLITTATSKVAIGTAPGIFSDGYTGTIGTGDVVTANPVWLPTPTSLGFQWEYASTPSGPYTKISGATKASYLIPQSLVGKYLFTVATAALTGHTTGSLQYSFGIVSKDQLTLVSTPKVTDVGGVYTVSNVKFSPAIPANSVDYEWYYYTENDAAPENTFTTEPSQNIGANAQANAHWALILYVPATVATNFYSYAFAPEPNILIKKGAIIPSGAVTLPASQVGQPITPSTITWLVQNPTLTRQWQYESGTTWHSIAATAGGTGATFTPGSTYLGHNIRVVTTASRTNYNTVSVTSSTTTVGIGAALVPGSGAGEATLNGYGIGSTWTALPGTWNLTGLTYHYQWASSASSSGPWTTIPSATAATYVPPEGLLGDYLRATISGSKAGYASASTTATSPALQSGEFRLTTAPKVTLSAGTYTVTSNGVWSPTATSYEYDWELFDPSTDLSTQVSTNNTYTPLLADAGKEIQLTIYPDRTGYNSGGTILTVRQGTTIAPTSPITLTGTPVIGNTLTLNVPGWNTASPEVHVTWYRNGVATGTNINELIYPLVTADLGKTISAKLVVSKSGYPGATFSFASTPTISDFVIAPTVDPVINGPLTDGAQQVGASLSATTGTWNTTGLTYTYQWYRSGVAIPGATSATYLLEVKDLGTEVTVDVTAAKTYYTPATDTSQAVTVNRGPNITNTVASPLVITGTPRVGNVLTLTILGKWSIPSTVAMQWSISNDGGVTWNYVYGAAGFTYTLSAADGVTVGTEVKATVYVSSPGYGDWGQDSSTVTVIP